MSSWNDSALQFSKEGRWKKTWRLLCCVTFSIQQVHHLQPLLYSVVLQQLTCASASTSSSFEHIILFFFSFYLLASTPSTPFVVLQRLTCASANSPSSFFFFFLIEHAIYTHCCVAAANLCFSERSIYTQEVLAIVVQRLMEQAPLPTLLMRTVIQSLSMYPHLIGFVLNILQRLIIKQVRLLPLLALDSALYSALYQDLSCNRWAAGRQLSLFHGV